MKIKILGITYEVEEVPQIDKYQRLLGEINYCDQVIKLEEGLSEDRYKATLIHEVFHGILDELGYEDLKSDEKLVQSVSAALYQVLKDNKEFAKLLVS